MLIDPEIRKDFGVYFKPNPRPTGRPRGHHRKTLVRLEEVRTLKASGMNNVTIARSMGISDRLVWWYLNRV